MLITIKIIKMIVMLLRIFTEERALELVKEIMAIETEETNDVLNEIYETITESIIHPKIVDLLYDNNRIDLEEDSGDIILWAAEQGRVELMGKILEDPRMKKYIDYDSIIAEAYYNKQNEIIKMVIPRMNVNEITDEKILRYVNEMDYLND